MAFEYSCFISYRHNDDEKDFYVNLKKILQSEALTATNKPKSFFDEEAIKYGEKWDDKIYEGVNKSYFFIPILHYQYLNTDNNWCARELMHAVKIESVIKNSLPEDERSKFFFIIPFIYRGNATELPHEIGYKQATVLKPFEYVIINNVKSQELVTLKQNLGELLYAYYRVLEDHPEIDFQALFNTIPRPTDEEVNDWINEQKKNERKQEAKRPPVLEKNRE